MYRSILVPLDRSSFAEQALPLALSVARRANARLELVEVHISIGFEFPELDTERKQQEECYLDTTSKWAASVSPVSFTAHVLPGQAVVPETVADRILERLRTIGADLIVMTTHPCSALSRVAIGSVADELIRRAHVPVLLVRPEKMAFRVFSEPIVDNVLIPLDGSTLAEQVLDSALDLVRLMEARCILLRVVEPHLSFSDHGSGRLSEKAQAERYLECVARRLQEQGLQLQARVVVARHPGETILGEAARQASTLIALATHGQGGIKRLLLGSVADQLVRTAGSPVLVYRPSEF
jgi:nucleotide-binding universal stress UspA family protein